MELKAIVHGLLKRGGGVYFAFIDSFFEGGNLLGGLLSLLGLLLV
jgi:hypothetical protein